MAILCGPVTDTISYVSKLICGRLVKISDIKPLYGTIDVLIDNQQVIPGIGSASVALIPDFTTRATINLISKNVSTSTATISFTIESIEVPPPVDISTHYIEYNLSFLPSNFLGLVGQNVSELSDTLGSYLPLPSNVSYTRSEYQNGIFRIYIHYTPILGMVVLESGMVEIVSMDIPTDLSLLAAAIAGILVFILLSRILVILGPWGLAGAAVVGVFAAIVTGFSVYDITTGLSLFGKNEFTPDKQIKAIRDYSAEVRNRCIELYPGCNTGNCSTINMQGYNKCIGAVNLAQYTNDEQQKGTFDQTKYDASKTGILAIDTCLSSGTCTTQQAATSINDATKIVNDNSIAAEQQTKCDPGYTYDKTKKQCVKTGLGTLETVLLVGVGALGLMYISKGKETVIYERGAGEYKSNRGR